MKGRLAASPNGSLHTDDAPGADAERELARVRSAAPESAASNSGEELARRLGLPLALAPALRGAVGLAEARALAAIILEPPTVRLPLERPTLERLAGLRGPAPDALDPAGAREIVRELKAVGGNLRAARLALTGRERGPALSAVLVALSRAEALRRIDAAL